MSSIGLFENDVEMFEANVPSPRTSLYKFIPSSGSPNRLLERMSPHEALAAVTQQHRKIADWIRAQDWGQNASGDQWRYIQVSKRLKACRQQLREMVRELEAGE